MASVIVNDEGGDLVFEGNPEAVESVFGKGDRNH